MNVFKGGNNACDILTIRKLRDNYIKMMDVLLKLLCVFFFQETSGT